MAAIAGQLLGATYGASAVPARYRRRLHGWPGMRVRDLHRLAFRTGSGGQSGPEGWPGAATIPSYATASKTVVTHPDDEDANNDLPGQLLDAARTVRDLRSEGKSVVHCVHAQTRTPVVAAVYGAMVTGSSAVEALGRVSAVLSGAAPRASFVRELERLVVSD